MAVVGCAVVAGSAAYAASISQIQAAVTGYLKQPTTIGSFPSLKTKPPKGKVVVYLATPEVSNVQVAAGVKQAAAAAHWTYFQASYNPADPSTFTAAFNVAIAKHANYVMEAGTPLPPAIISSAAAHHIKIALDAVYPATVTGPVIDSSDGFTQDNLMGRIVADEFIIDSKGKGQAVEEAVPSYPILTAFSSGFQSQVHADCPGCKIAMANVTIPQLEAGQLGSVVVSAVKANPGYNYLVFDDGPFADGITSALSAQGITGEKILGEAGDTAGIAALKAGTELAWTGYSVPFDSWEMMDAAFRNSEGMPVPKADATQPTQLITHANAGKVVLYPTLGGWNYPTNGFSEFEKVWKITG